MAKVARKKLGETVKRPPLPKAEIDFDGLENLGADEVKSKKPARRSQSKKKKKPAPSDGETRRLSVDIDKALFQRFKARCAEQDVTLREKIEQYIEKEVG